jgi:hypothetical protein
MNYSSDYEEEYEPDYDDDVLENSQTFYISRHLNSCNNMVDDAKWTNISYKFSEPPLSMWGIISGLALQRKLLGNFKNKVYVSCLVRTWMTAIIEYFPHTTSQVLDLIVSPYIKESDLSNKYYVGQTIDAGNMPESVAVQIEKIKYFFSFLRLIQQYFKQMKSQNSDEYRKKSYDENILKIQMNLDNILKGGNKINIIFPTFSTIKNGKKIYVDYKIYLNYDESIKKLVSMIELKENNNKITSTDSAYKVDPYFYKITKNDDFSLSTESENEIQQGGDDDVNYNYFKSMLKTFLEQNLTNDPDEVIDLNDKPFKPLKINKKNKKADYFNRSSKVGIYTTSFGKESVLLFIDWIKNVIQDQDQNIYVVAHSNIMQATLYNICEKINNTIIKKKNVNDCHEGLYDIVKKQNIWELIIKVNNDSITSVKVRQGQYKPDNNSKKVTNYGREKGLSCGKDVNNIERMLSSKQKQSEEVKHRPIIVQGQKIQQPAIQQPAIQQPAIQQPAIQQQMNQEPKGLFGKFKQFFTKKRGGKYKYSRNQNNKKYTRKYTSKRRNTKRNKK